MKEKTKNLKIITEGKKSILNDNLYVTDYPDSERIDAVFPICFENKYFVNNLDVGEGNLVLDLCTGSGIIAIEAAKKAKKVIAIDINPRALEFAKTNSKLNAVDNKIDFRLGNLFEPVNGLKFDAIFANPPFEPVHTDYTYYLHSDGGNDGLKIVKKIITEVNNYLHKDGIFQMITFIPIGSESISNILKQNFDVVNIKVLKKIKEDEFVEYFKRNISKLNKISFEKNDLLINDMELIFITVKGLKGNE